VSQAESPQRSAASYDVKVEDVRQLMGHRRPHFALQLRNRIAKLVDGLPVDHPARVLGERRSAGSSSSAWTARPAAAGRRTVSARSPRCEAERPDAPRAPRPPRPPRPRNGDPAPTRLAPSSDRDAPAHRAAGRRRPGSELPAPNAVGDYAAAGCARSCGGFARVQIVRRDRQPAPADTGPRLLRAARRRGAIPCAMWPANDWIGSGR